MTIKYVQKTWKRREIEIEIDFSNVPMRVNVTHELCIIQNEKNIYRMSRKNQCFSNSENGTILVFLFFVINYKRYFSFSDHLQLNCRHQKHNIFISSIAPNQKLNEVKVDLRV